MALIQQIDTTWISRWRSVRITQSPTLATHFITTSGIGGISAFEISFPNHTSWHWYLHYSTQNPTYPTLSSRDQEYLLSIAKLVTVLLNNLLEVFRIPLFSEETNRLAKPINGIQRRWISWLIFAKSRLQLIWAFGFFFCLAQCSLLFSSAHWYQHLPQQNNVSIIRIECLLNEVLL